MAARNASKRLTVCEAITAIYNDSDSESEPEIDCTDNEYITDDVDAISSENGGNIQQVNRDNVLPETEYEFQWELSGFDDTYEMDWLKEFNVESRNVQKGILVDTDSLERPVDFFKLFFPDELFDCIAENTNLYATQFFDNPSIEDDLPTHSRFRKWSQTSADEIKQYVALQIAMGICTKPEISDYWGTFWLTRVPFEKVMARNRYELLSSFLHFNDNSKYVERGKPGYNPLFKVQPLLDITDPTYTSAYYPGRELSIDESMIKFKGRIFFRQYLPSKPTKWGIKQFALCESSTGYALKFLTYTGKHTFDRTENLSLSEHVVLKLIEGYENKGHRLYTDNFYTSPNLCVSLKERNIGLCGTVKPNRKNFPKDLQPSILKLNKSDDPVFMRSGCTVACAWQDTKRVHFVSTIHNNLTIDKKIRSKDGNGGHRDLEKPVMAEDYNKFMNGVDRLDQLLGTYAYPHKSAKWYHTIYHRVREVALVNGYILYCKHVNGGKGRGPKQFREEVISQLLEESDKNIDANLRRRGRPSIDTNIPPRLSGRHFMSMFEDSKQKPDCFVCSDRKKQGWKRKQTRFYCKNCDIALCAVPCFEIFHTKMDYKQEAANKIYKL